MNVWEVIVLVAILALSVFGLIFSIRKNNKNKGCGCGGNCSACSGCHTAKQKDKEVK